MPLEALGKQQPQGEKTDNGPAARHEAAKQTKPDVHGEGGKQTPKHTDVNLPGLQQ